MAVESFILQAPIVGRFLQKEIKVYYGNSKSIKSVVMPTNAPLW